MEEPDGAAKSELSAASDEKIRTGTLRLQGINTKPKTTPDADNSIENRDTPSLKAPGSAKTPETEDESGKKLSKAEKKKLYVTNICDTLEKEATRSNLPKEFLTRLIWKESRFDANAVSPVGAEGIAQFMPGTAKLRKLKDPFDPKSAIAASAVYLAELTQEFGNLGYAAAAYNAGENRVTRWLAGNSGLPYETRDYVESITGITAEEWKTGKSVKASDLILDKKLTFQEACRLLPVRSTGFKVRMKSAAWQPWGVQVAANFSRGKALKIYSRLKSRYNKVLGNRDPMVVRKVNRSRGRRAMYSVRLGAPNRGKALDICQRLRAMGASCVVVKN